MTETTVRADTCSNCGIKTRDEAEFCFNCGSRVAQLVEVLQETSEPESSVPGFVDLPAGPPPSDRIPMPDISLEAVELIEERPAPVKEPMRTAASLRRDRNRQIAKPKEVVWVQTEGPGIAFLASSIIIVIITGLILLGAVYLK